MGRDGIKMVRTGVVQIDGSESEAYEYRSDGGRESGSVHFVRVTSSVGEGRSSRAGEGKGCDGAIRAVISQVAFDKGDVAEMDVKTMWSMA